MAVPHLAGEPDEGSMPIPILIDGKAVRAEATFPIVSPSSGQVVASCASASPALAVRAVDSCAAAFRSWRASGLEHRRRVLLRTADLLEQRLDEGARLMGEEVATPAAVARDVLFPIALRLLRALACQIDGVCGRIVRPDADGRSGMVLREPIGVVLGIVAW
ncbi:hypothetical protein KEM52_000243 [Ascosphaera acerosa]|nr:hypothetical protein KEM52_000243 [Ascosphaera acerosa]